MAAIPTLTEPRTRTEPLRAVDQPAPDTGGAALVSGLAQASEALGAAVSPLMEARQRLDIRDDTLRRINLQGKIKGEVQKEYLAGRMGTDFTTDDVAALRGKMHGIFDKYSGEAKWRTPAGELEFAEALARDRASWDDVLTSEGLKASKAALDTHLEGELSRLAAMVASNPDASDDVTSEWRDIVGRDYASGATAEEETDKRLMGEEVIAVARLERFFGAGDWEAVLDEINNPGPNAPFISEPEKRNLRMRAYSAEAEQKRANSKNIVLGSNDRLVDPLTGEVVVDARPGPIALNVNERLVDPTTGRTLAGVQRDPITLNVNESLVDPVTGKTIREAREDPKRTVVLGPNDSLVDPETGETIVEAQPKPFTADDIVKSTGSAMAWLSSIESKIAARELTTEEFSYMSWALARIQSSDDQGRIAPVPDTIREALWRGYGIQVQELTSPGVDPSVLAAIAAQAGQPMPDEVLEAMEKVGGVNDRVNGIIASVPPGPLGQQNPEAMAVAFKEHHVGLYMMADELTGPWAVLKGSASKIPFIGSYFAAPETNRMQTIFGLAMGFIAKALQQGERFADAERSFLVKENLKELKTKIVAEPEATQDMMTGLDDVLATLRVSYAEGLKQEGAVSAQGFQNLQDGIRSIDFARGLLGVPPLVQDPEKARAEGRLKPGDLFRWIDPGTGDMLLIETPR